MSDPTGLCDYRLPEETGVEAVASLHAELGMPVPAVLISGDASEAVARSAAEAGHALMRKPLQPAKLRALLVDLLAGQSVDAA